VIGVGRSLNLVEAPALKKGRLEPQPLGCQSRPSFMAAQPDWTQLVLTSSAIAAIVSGGVQLLMEYIRGRQHHKRKFEEVLVEKRVDGCDRLLRLVLDAERAISPVSQGTKVLQAPEYDPFQGKHTENGAYEQVKAKFAELDQFVNAEELIVGAELARTWHRYRSAFQELEWRISERNQESNPEFNNMHLFYALIHLTYAFVNDMRTAAKKTLATAEFTLLDIDAIQISRRVGHEWIRQLLVKIKDDPKAYSLDPIAERQMALAKTIVQKELRSGSSKRKDGLPPRS
jgi:hypothetical protein